MAKTAPRGKIVSVVSFHVKNDIGYASVRFENGTIKKYKEAALNRIDPQILKNFFRNSGNS